VLSVSFLFFDVSGSVCGCMCVYTHTYTHTAHGVLDASPGVGTKPWHLEVLKNTDGLNLSIYIFVYVYKVHMHIYMLSGGMRSWTNCSFCEHTFSSEKKTKVDCKTENSNPNHNQSTVNTKSSFSDCQRC